MRIVLLLCFFFLFLNCQDKQSKQKLTPETVDTKAIKKDSTEADTDAFERLDSRSAMEFFLEYDKHHKENKVRITTDFGSFDILLYNETKFHRSNFIFLTKRKYFVDTQFYRVIDDYMVQAGNSDDVKISKKRGKIGKYLLPPDTKRGFKHDRGVISMPSSAIDNPHKLASPYEFFIIQQHGGSHFLDGDYTVFGHVTRGMDVIDKIAAVDTGEGDWPLQNIYIRDCEIIE